MKSLVIQTSFLGDMVLTTPLLSYLATLGDVDVVGTAAASALLANHPAVRESIVYDKRGADSGLGGFLRLSARLRHEHYDQVLLAQGSTRSGALALATGAKRRIGFDTSAGRMFYSETVPYVDNEHHAQRLLRLAGPGAATHSTRPTLHPGAAERAAVDALIGGRGGPFLAIAPGSVWATKRWPSYSELIGALKKRGTVVVIGSSIDRAHVDNALAIAGNNVIDATGKLSLLGSAELLGRCAVLVTNDSAPQHLASAMNTPTVTVFGPTVPAFGFGPLADRATTVGIDSLPCRPCDRHGPVACPLGHWKCMRDVTVAQVLGAVDEVVG